MNEAVINLDVEVIRERALGLFAEGCNCAETFLMAFAPEFGWRSDVMMLATPLGAGIGGRRDLCGMVVSGAMVIGMAYGRTDSADFERKSDAMRRAGRFYRWFKTERQLKCSEIVTGRFTGHTDDCVCLMEDATAKLIEILKDGAE